MIPNKVPHLCGGILFGLLLESRKSRIKARNKLKGGTDGLKATDIFNGLINVVTGDTAFISCNTNSKCVSNYKNCISSKGVYVPFTDPATQSAFDAKYKLKKPDIYERMSGFIDTYLNKDKCEWLVRALIETMQQEQLNAEIAISYTENCMVRDLHKADIIIFLPFLLSIIHYVVMECPDCESGRSTFETWYSQSNPRAEWKFKSNIGNGIQPMNVSMDLSIPFQYECDTIIEDEITPAAKTWQTAYDTQGDGEVITSNIGKTQGNDIAETNLNNEKTGQTIAHNDLFDCFKTNCDHILQYCIKKDPTAEPISFSIHYQIEELAEKWEFNIRKVKDPKERMLIQEVIQTLSDYTYYLSDKFLKFLDEDRLIFRNSSREEGERLRNELRPKSYELRKKMAELYRKLWPAPELDQPTANNVASSSKGYDNPENQNNKKSHVVHQTVVNQYGDHPVHIDHVDNLKL